MSIPTLLRIPILLMPVTVAEAIANAAYRKVMSRHPAMFDRMENHRECLFGFVPTDWPVAFLARPSSRSIEVRRKPLKLSPDVIVEAPFPILLKLLQGGADGDALFFSRAIQVSGNMEALVALRNSLDDASVDLVEDLLGSGSPLAPFLRSAMEHFGRTR